MFTAASKRALGLVFATLWTVGGGHRADAEELQAAARLIAATRTIQAGVPFTVGIHIRLPAGAHIYWINPGDAGLPTRVEWRLPAGFSAGPIQWPVPALFSDPPLASYGYAEEIVLPVVITPPPDLAGAVAVRIAARVDWLLCKETCVPGGADVALGFRVAAGPGEPTADADLLARFVERVPRPSDEWQFHFEESADEVRLRVRPPPTIEREALARFLFFCSAEDVIEPSAPQTWSAGEGDGEYVLTLRKTARRRPIGDRLEGVLREGAGYPARADERFVGVSAARMPATP